MDTSNRTVLPFIASFFYTITFWLFLLSSAYAQKSQDPTRKDTIAGKVAFGMRVRELPKEKRNIYEPVLVGKAPGNEATLIKLASGEVKLFFINRPGKANQMISITSHDNGSSWGAPEKEFDLPGEAYYANQVLQDEKGDIHCIFHIFAKGENGYRGRHLDLWYSRTINRKWTKPRKIYDGYVGSMRGFIQLKNKRLLLAFAKAVPKRSAKPLPNKPDYGWNDIISLYSDDYGKTWQSSTNSIQVEVESSNVTRYGGVEPAIIELNNGTVWMLIRTNKGRLYQSYSENAGTSWSAPNPTDFISSDSPATILRLSDNRLLILWCSNQRHDDVRSYANGGRKVLHAAVSHDEGKTWKGFREVLTGSPQSYTKGDRGTAYPSAVETTEGKILAVSGQGEESAIFTFDPDWLEEEHVGDSFKNLAQWTLFGIDPCTGLSPLPTTEEHRKSLFISRTNNNSTTEAVWNFPSGRTGKIELEILALPGITGINIALTDHFSVSSDSLASSQSIVNTLLETGPIKDKGSKMKINIQWDSQRQKAFIHFDKHTEQVPFKRRPSFGLNYLRLGVSGAETCKEGYYIKSIAYFSQ